MVEPTSKSYNFLDDAEFAGNGLFGGRLCLAFVNHEQDWSKSKSDLFIFLESAALIDQSCRLSVEAKIAEDLLTEEDVLSTAKTLSDLLRRIFSSLAKQQTIGGRDLMGLNALLPAAFAELSLKQSPNLVWYRPPITTLQAIFNACTRSAIALLTSGALSRLRRCAADDCDYFFLDESKNSSRRWCDMSECGSRAKAKRFYSKSRGK